MKSYATLFKKNNSTYLCSASSALLCLILGWSETCRRPVESLNLGFLVELLDDLLDWLRTALDDPSSLSTPTSDNSSSLWALRSMVELAFFESFWPFLNLDNLLIVIVRSKAAFLASKLWRFSISVNLASNQIANSLFNVTSLNTWKKSKKETH